MNSKLHLNVMGSDPATEGELGCDYAWGHGGAAYRCLPHRWAPGSDSSYAAWQARDPYYDAAEEGQIAEYDAYCDRVEALASAALARLNASEAAGGASGDDEDF